MSIPAVVPVLAAGCPEQVAAPVCLRLDGDAIARWHGAQLGLLSRLARRRLCALWHRLLRKWRTSEYGPYVKLRKLRLTDRPPWARPTTFVRATLQLAWFDDAA
jgi:hypothetical protein